MKRVRIQLPSGDVAHVEIECAANPPVPFHRLTIKRPKSSARRPTSGRLDATR